MKRIILLEKRKKARELREKGWSIQKIARYLGANWESVKRWLAMDNRDLGHDRRGRTKGKALKYDDVQKRRVLEIRTRLQAEGRAYGARAVIEAYRDMYRDTVSSWFVNTVAREARIESELPSNHDNDAFVQFPYQKLTAFGKITMSLDFVGVRRNRGRQKSTCFLSARYLSPAKLGVLAHVEGRSCDEVKKTMRYVWLRYVKPDVIRMNMHPAFGAGLPHPRILGAWTLALLNMGIIPFYSGGSGASPLELDRLEKMFEKTFADKLLFGNECSSGICLRNFYMEYLDERDGGKAERLKVPSLPFNRWVNGMDLDNRNVRCLRETKVFFLAA